MPDIGKLKNQQEKVKTEIRQLENRQKILLNRKRMQSGRPGHAA